MDDSDDDYDNHAPDGSSQPLLDKNDNHTRRSSSSRRRGKRTKNSGRGRPGNKIDSPPDVPPWTLSGDGNNDIEDNNDHGEVYHDPGRSYLTACLTRPVPDAARAVFNGILLTIVLLTLSWALSRTPLVLHTIPEDAVNSSGTFGIPLHPEEHIHRDPISITLHWKITHGIRYPDGVRKKVYLVNGQFPGPVIECRSMDRLFIHVTNAVKEEGISIHWHGLNMKGANDMDGASGVTQCPIKPGNKFIYEFSIDPGTSGTFWYHAYSDSQKADGLYGGLIVHNAEAVHTDLRTYGYQKEALFLIGDWYHRSGQEVLNWYLTERSLGYEGREPSPDSLLINGAGKFPCSKALPERPIKCVEKWVDKTPGLFNSSIYEMHTRMRIVNVGSLAGLDFAFTSGNFDPITVDGGHPILRERSARIGVLSPGERVDLVLRTSAVEPREARQMHIFFKKYPNPALTAHQSFPYVASNSTPTLDWKHSGLGFDGEIVSLEPYDLAVASTLNPVDSPPERADQRIVLTTIEHSMKLRNETWRGFSRLFPLINGSHTWGFHVNTNEFVPWIPLTDSKPIWVDLVMYNLLDHPQPYHLHGYSFFVVASESSLSGWPRDMLDVYRGGTIRLSPAKKDTILVPGCGFVALRFLADNPGIWMFHSSVMFHTATAVTMGIAVGKNESYTMDSDTWKNCCPDETPY